MTFPMTSTAELDTARDIDLEQETANFLQQLSDVQAELLEVLHLKRAQMVANDLEAMEQTLQSEQALLERLDLLRQSRESLLQGAKGQGMPADSVQSLVRAFGDSSAGRLASRATAAKDAMRHIQNETLSNFVLAQQTVLHLSQLLQIIATGGRIKPTYEAENASNQGGTLVDQDA